MHKLKCVKIADNFAENFDSACLLSPQIIFAGGGASEFEVTPLDLISHWTPFVVN